MEYVLLIAIIGYVVFRAVLGYKKGFITQLLSVANLLIAIIIAALLTAPIAGILKNNTSFYDNVKVNVTNYVEDSSIIDKSALDKSDLPEAIKDVIIDKADDNNDFMNGVIDTVSDIIFKALVFIALVVLFYIIIKILIKVLDLIAKLPVLRSINKVAGLLLGLIIGMITIWIACTVLTIFSNTQTAQSVFALINKNDILSLIYNNNLLVILVTTWLV